MPGGLWSDVSKALEANNCGLDLQHQYRMSHGEIDYLIDKCSFLDKALTQRKKDLKRKLDIIMSNFKVYWNNDFGMNPRKMSSILSPDLDQAQMLMNNLLWF